LVLQDGSGSIRQRFWRSSTNKTKPTTATTYHKSTNLNLSPQRQNYKPRPGPATLTAVETTDPAENINRHCKPLAGPATPLRWRQPARRNTPATRQAGRMPPAAMRAQKQGSNPNHARLRCTPLRPLYPQRQNYTPRAGPATLTAVEKTGQAGNTRTTFTKKGRQSVSGR
jgi:hypothetical protein